MALEKLDIDKISNCFAEVCKAEKDVLNEQREIAKKLYALRQPLNLEKWKGKAIAFVAADGGDSRIRLDSSSTKTPAVVELVRVADSDGKSVMVPVAGAADDANFDEIHNLDEMEELCRDLRCEKISDLSPYLGRIKRLGHEKSSRTIQMRTYREIMEWAVFYRQLKTCESNTLVVSDGALRTRRIEPDIFNKLAIKIRKITEKKPNVYCVGVAKQTVLLNRLRLAISMENVFEEGAQYIPVSYEIAKKFYSRRWLGTMDTEGYSEYSSLANMYLVKFGEHPLDPVWPVDIATWQKDKAEAILGYLARDARNGFPIPDFPMCIQKAHDHAKIGGIEMSYLQELLFDKMQEDMNGEDSEKILRARYLTEDVSARRYPNEN